MKGDQEPKKDDRLLMGFSITAVLAKLADRSVLVAKNREGEPVALRLGRAVEKWMIYGV